MFLFVYFDFKLPGHFNAWPGLRIIGLSVEKVMAIQTRGDTSLCDPG